MRCVTVMTSPKVSKLQIIAECSFLFTMVQNLQKSTTRVEVENNVAGFNDPLCRSDVRHDNSFRNITKDRQHPGNSVGQWRWEIPSLSRLIIPSAGRRVEQQPAREWDHQWHAVVLWDRRQLGLMRVLTRLVSWFYTSNLYIRGRIFEKS